MESRPDIQGPSAKEAFIIAMALILFKEKPNFCRTMGHREILKGIQFTGAPKGSKKELSAENYIKQMKDSGWSGFTQNCVDLMMIVFHQALFIGIKESAKQWVSRNKIKPTINEGTESIYIARSSDGKIHKVVSGPVVYDSEHLDSGFYLIDQNEGTTNSDAMTFIIAPFEHVFPLDKIEIQTSES
ncbi:MAG: hypothetical protein IBX55_01285 [Methyloprofundus sp.]|nr:hypothetical protein [Methyloprofundus sp.]